MEEFLKNGEKPAFVEVGPFVYEEIRRKSNITNKNDTFATYEQDREYRFIKEKSAWGDDYSVTTLNLAAMTLIENNNRKKFQLNLAFRLSGTGNLIIKKPVSSILFGYNDSLFKTYSKFDRGFKYDSDIVRLFHFVSKIF